MRRLEADFGWLDGPSWNVLQWTGIYQWQFIRNGGFSVYAGPGLGFGYASYNFGKDKFYGVTAVNVGADYTFPKMPFQVGVDYRPEYSWLNEVGEDLSHQIALAIRLAF